MLTCGKDNLLRCVDVRRFEARKAPNCADPQRCRAAASTHVHLMPARADTHCPPCLPPLPAPLCLPPLPAPLACPPSPAPLPLQVRHTLSAPSFNVGGAWTAACLRCDRVWAWVQVLLQHWPAPLLSFLVTTSTACALLRRPLLPACCCSPSEKQAAAGSADGTVLLWDLATSAVAARLRDPRQHQPAVACAWCPLGLPLVSSDKGGGLTFWTAARASPSNPAGSGGGRR